MFLGFMAVDDDDTVGGWRCGYSIGFLAPRFLAVVLGWNVIQGDVIVFSSKLSFKRFYRNIFSAIFWISLTLMPIFGACRTDRSLTGASRLPSSAGQATAVLVRGSDHLVWTRTIFRPSCVLRNGEAHEG